MNKLFVKSIIGVVLLLVGIFVSGDMLFDIFGGAYATMEQDFADGALLFKLGLCAIGLYILAAQLAPTQTQIDDKTPNLYPSSRLQNRIFFGLLILATLLRLYHLNQGIWFDEMLTHVNYMPLSVGEIIGTYKDPNNHLLFSILARISLSIFGDSVWAFRLPAVLFGIGSIAAVFYFSRRATSTTVSLFAVALMTLSYHHIWFSQNARGYTALLFFTLISSTFFLDALRQNKPRKWLLYAATAALGVFTHLTMGFLVIAQFLIYAISQLKAPSSNGRTWWNGLLFGFVPLGLLSLQSYALILPGMFGGSLLSSGLQGKSSEWTNPVWALMEVVNGMQIGFANSGIALVAAVVLGIGLFDFTRKRPEFIGLFLIPTLFGLLLMTSIGYTLFPRFFFFAMGFGVIVLMHGAATTGRYFGQIFKLPPSRAAWLPTLFCVGIVAASLPSLRYVYYPKQNYAGAIELIEKERRDGDTVVTIGIADFPFNAYYQMNWKNVKSIEELDAILSQTDRTWLVYTMPVHAKSAYPDILERMGQEYNLVKRFYGTLNGGDVVVSLEKTSVVHQSETPGE